MSDRHANRTAIVAAALAMAFPPCAAWSQLQRIPPSVPDTVQLEDQLGPWPGENLPLERDLFPHPPPEQGEIWSWQPLPEGVLYHSYLAGVKESRLGTSLLHDENLGWVWDHTLGARVGAIRYGTLRDDHPEGWQLDFEGAAFLRQDPEEELDVVGTDFRAGIPLTYARGPLHAKFAIYHTSSHVGDEFLLKNPTFQRINYKRDALVLGIGYYVTDSLRLYGEAGWAFGIDGGAEPWEFQFGAEFSPRTYHGFWGTPFWAVNGHLRQELNFGGSLSVHAGWQWRSPHTGRVMRLGFQYFNGATPLYEFFDRHEELIGAGLWYDF